MSQSELLLFLTSQLGKLDVGNNTSKPQPTKSEANYYGLDHIEMVSKNWPDFEYDYIVKKYGHILNTPTKQYIPQPPTHPRAAIFCERDFIESFGRHLEQTINYALDVTLNPPALIALRDHISHIEGHPKFSKFIFTVLPHRITADMLNNQYGWRIQLNADESQILGEIRDHLKMHFRGSDTTGLSKEDQFEVARLFQEGLNNDTLSFLLALSLRNVLSQYTIPERLYSDDNYRHHLEAFVAVLPLNTKVNHILPWIAMDKADKFRKLLCAREFKTEHVKPLIDSLPPSLKAACQGYQGTAAQALNFLFASLPSPLRRHRHFGGKENFGLIRMVPTGGIIRYQKLAPDLASNIPEQPNRNVLPGDFKFSKNWRPYWDVSNDLDQADAFWSAISQVQCYTYQYEVRYGYLISDTGFRCFQRVSKSYSGKEASLHGQVLLSPPIKWDAKGEQLTLMLALWYLHLLAADDNRNLPSELWTEETEGTKRTMEFNSGRILVDKGKTGYVNNLRGRNTSRSGSGGGGSHSGSTGQSSSKRVTWA
ncbi:hypothetical protein BU17DRAFT_96430 [Hysterangium stoloniferum]|nr:hypothetical protein BU17DRAFT_96430 [Hysterangium stoloniferum]